jgi:hypothetical protein
VWVYVLVLRWTGWKSVLACEFLRCGQVKNQGRCNEVLEGLLCAMRVRTGACFGLAKTFTLRVASLS